jgi:hypothetical protein
MLKICILDTGRQRRLVVEGKLIGLWAAELKRVCDRATTDLNGRELVIEVRELTVISEEGESVLLDLINEGVRLRGRGSFAKQVLRHLARKAQTQLRKATS